MLNPQLVLLVWGGLGARLIDLNDAGGIDQHDPALVKQVNLPNGLIWNSYWLPRVVMEADFVIGVPVLKNLALAGVTLALKGQIGIAPSDIYHNPDSKAYKGALGHGPNDLCRHIVDLNLARPLDFVVVDALRRSSFTSATDSCPLSRLHPTRRR